MEKGDEGKRTDAQNFHDGEIFRSKSECTYTHSLLIRDLAP